MGCKYASDRLMQDQYTKAIWNMFIYKPAYTHCKKYNDVCFVCSIGDWDSIFKQR